MTIDQHQLYVPGKDAGRASALSRLARELAPHDWLIVAYLVMLNLTVLGAPACDARTESLTHFATLLAFFVFSAVLIRGRLLTHGVVPALLYRLAAMSSVFVSYLLLADLLPLVNSGSLDSELYALDLTLFGGEPTLYLDRFVTPATTEWFAFFYFGYFFVLALHVFPILFLEKSQRALGQFSLGLLLVFGIGQTLYFLVPGFGPHHAIPEAFAHELPHGIWWDMTVDLVSRSGAQKDIFPSLHTAAPTFILMFSFHQRHRLPFRFTYPLVAFFALNIVIATLFLRWHWLVDVVAGLLLALTAHIVSVRVTRAELCRRAQYALTPLWPQWRASPGSEPATTEAVVAGE